MFGLCYTTPAVAGREGHSNKHWSRVKLSFPGSSVVSGHCNDQDLSQNHENVESGHSSRAKESQEAFAYPK